MTIIIVGDWEYEFYEKALYDGFKSLGNKVYKFSTADFMKYPSGSVLKNFLSRNSEINIVNKKLIEYVKHIQPELIFFQRPVFIRKETLSEISNNSKAMLFSYHNDNPFDTIKNRLRNYHYIKSLNNYNLNFVYRPSNLSDIKKYSEKPAKVLKPYYVYDLHNAMTKSIHREIDVIFVGHYEKFRDEYCKYLGQAGIKLEVVGPDWKNSKTINIDSIKYSAPVDSYEYVRLLNNSKIALAFLSKKNNDVYTRRNFEITAAGTFMLSERTEELQEIFIEGKECDYFSSKEELLDKVNFYLKNSVAREKIASAGYEKCIRSGNSNIDRAKEIIDTYKEL